MCRDRKFKIGQNWFLEEMNRFSITFKLVVIRSMTAPGMLSPDSIWFESPWGPDSLLQWRLNKQITVIISNVSSQLKLLTHVVVASRFGVTEQCFFLLKRVRAETIMQLRDLPCTCMSGTSNKHVFITPS